MNISRSDLYRIILEEYAKEEGITLSENKADDLLKWLRGGEKPDWVDDDREIPDPPEVPDAPPAAADTMPFGPSDIPSDDAPERDVSGFQDRAGPPLEDQLMDLIQGMPPEEVADLFQAVFEKIPGVELGAPEEEPETLYSPGAEGRPQISLGPLREAVFKKIMEMGMGSYGLRSMAGIPGNRDDGYENLSDAELIDMAERDGIEEILILDGEGDLVNREEVVAALKNV